jgi:DNA mismatch repair protein MutL
LVSELAERIANDDSPDFIDAIRDEVLGNIACKSSIRAGRKLSIDEMNALLRAIENTANSSQCNHGRPTFVVLKDSNLARIFER